MPEGVFAYSNTHPKYPKLSDTKTTAILKYRKDLRCALSLNHCYQFGDKNQNANLKVEGTDGVVFITLGSTVNYPNFEKDKFEIKTKDRDWEEVKLELRNFIKKFIEEDGKIINPQSSTKKEEKSLKDIDKKIIQILEEYIKPAVEQDGGAIQFESFEKGTVKVSLQGACSGCPSSMITLKSGIEKLLKRFIPEVEEVVAEGV